MKEIDRLRNIVKTCVCGRCWGDLMLVVGDKIVCINSLNGNCDGGEFYTSKKYAERRRLESKLELIEVRNNYPDLEGTRKKLSNKQILEDLGV